MKERTDHMSVKTSAMIHKLSEYQKSSVKKDLKEISRSDKKMNHNPQKNKEKQIR